MIWATYKYCIVRYTRRYTLLTFRRNFTSIWFVCWAPCNLLPCICVCVFRVVVFFLNSIVHKYITLLFIWNATATINNHSHAGRDFHVGFLSLIFFLDLYVFFSFCYLPHKNILLWGCCLLETFMKKSNDEENEWINMECAVQKHWSRFRNEKSTTFLRVRKKNYYWSRNEHFVRLFAVQHAQWCWRRWRRQRGEWAFVVV